MNKKLSKKLILIALIIIPFLVIYNSVATADEETPFAMMYITCFTYDMRHIGNITMEFYQDKTITAHLTYDMVTGRCGGVGKGTWNATGPFFTANFMVNMADEEQKITFSISGMTILTSIPQLSESSCPLFSVLGVGNIIDPEHTFSEEEKISSWFFGVCSSDTIRIIPH